MSSGLAKRPPIPPEKPARSQAAMALLSRSGVGLGEDKQKAASDGDLRGSSNGLPKERGIRFAVGASRSRDGEVPLLNIARRYNVCGDVTERTNVTEEIRKRCLTTPALPASPKNVTLNSHVAVLTGRPQDNTTSPEVESDDPDDEEQTEGDKEEEEEEEADMPQSGEGTV